MVSSLQGPRDTAGCEAPHSAAGLGCVRTVYLVFGPSSPRQFCTKQGMLSFHAWSFVFYEQLSLLVAALTRVILPICWQEGTYCGWLYMREVCINTFFFFSWDALFIRIFHWPIPLIFNFGTISWGSCEQRALPTSRMNQHMQWD